MTDIDIAARFQDMEPIENPPGLYTLNSIGTSIYGRRDYDPETNSYVKTVCFCVLYIPLFALGAYRVIDDGPNSWHFLGRVPLSDFARKWNRGFRCFFAVAILGVIAYGVWQGYFNSPQYIAGRGMEKAATMARDGDRLGAFQTLGDLLRNPRIRDRRPLKEEITAQLGAVATAELAEHKPEKTHGMLMALRALEKDAPGTKIIPDVRGRSLKFAASMLESNPRYGLDVLYMLQWNDETQGHAEALALKEKLLEKALAATPGAVDLVEKLSLIYMGRKDVEAAEKLLAPLEASLGISEGARILGEIRLEQNRDDEAYKLLYPYVNNRLERMRVAGEKVDRIWDDLSDRALDKLNNNTDSPKYKELIALSGDEQQEKVDEYLNEVVEPNPQYQRALKEYHQYLPIVGNAMDLGMLQLARARNMKDTSARRKELEEAEKTFLAVQGPADGYGNYQYTLGQIYYWLGKEEQGKQQFDRLLESNKRSFEVLSILGDILREIGIESDARALMEEAYKKAPSDEEGDDLAVSISVLTYDVKEKIRWLKKVKHVDEHVKNRLTEARGLQAMLSGDEKKAEKLFRASVRYYAKQTVTSTTANNLSLCHRRLYYITGNPGHLQKAIECMEKAVELSPGDAIVLGNITGLQISMSVLDLLGDKVNLKVIRDEGSLSQLPLLYSDEAGRAEVIQRLQQNPGFIKALANMEKLLVLAAKSPNAVTLALKTYYRIRDIEKLKALVDQLALVAPDMTARQQFAADYYSGKDDAADLKDALKRLEVRKKQLARAKKIGGKTYALIAADMAEDLMDLRDYGGKPDADRICAHAQEAYEADVNEYTRGMLISALLYRARQSMAKVDSAFKAFDEKNAKSLSSETMLVWHAGQNPSFAASLKNNKDWKAACKLQREAIIAYPDTCSASEWAFSLIAWPDMSADIAKNVKTNQRLYLLLAATEFLPPLYGGRIVEHYWYNQINGDTARAEAVLNAGRERGIPLP